MTVSCAEGETGFVYEGLLEFDVRRQDLKQLERPKTKIMMNVGNPEEAFRLSFIPNDGVGLAREEFIISNYIKIHPMALARVRSAGRPGRAGGDRPAHGRLCRQAPVLRRQAGAGRGDDRAPPFIPKT